VLGRSVYSMHSVCLLQLVNSSYLAITVASLRPIHYSVSVLCKLWVLAMTLCQDGTQARPSMSCVTTSEIFAFNKTSTKRSEETIVRARLGPGRASEQKPALALNDYRFFTAFNFVSYWRRFFVDPVYINSRYKQHLTLSLDILHCFQKSTAHIISLGLAGRVRCIKIYIRFYWSVPVMNSFIPGEANPVCTCLI